MGRDTRAGGSYVEVYADDKGLRAGLDRASKKLQLFGASAISIGKKVLTAGAGIGAAFIPAIKAASDLEETMNKFNVVFGDQAEAAKAWGDEFAGQVGRSKRQVADFLASSQDLFVPLGFEPGAAEKMSKQITRLSIDLASFNNMQDEDTLRDLQAALTGSGEVMKKYGVIVSEAAVKQEALNMGLNPKELTDQQKVQARLNIIMRGTTAAQGDAIRSSESFANKSKALWGELENLAAVVGQQVLPVITPLVSDAANAVKLFGEWSEANPELVKALGATAVALVTLGGGLVAVGVAAKVTAGAMGVFSTAVNVASGAQKLFIGHAAAMRLALGAMLPLVAAVGAAYAVFTLQKFISEMSIGERLLTKFNDEFERTKKLGGETIHARDKPFNEELKKASMLVDPARKKQVLQAELDRQRGLLAGRERDLATHKRQQAETVHPFGFGLKNAQQQGNQLIAERDATRGRVAELEKRIREAELMAETAAINNKAIAAAIPTAEAMKVPAMAPAAQAAPGGGSGLVVNVLKEIKSALQDQRPLLEAIANKKMNW